MSRESVLKNMVARGEAVFMNYFHFGNTYGTR